MTEYPLVTIVALCYNQAQYAEETLDSILAQTYPNIQLIIMDDSSTDNSVDVIRKWIDRNQLDCTFIAHKENKGICKTLNEALDLVEGEYYQAIACDDVMLCTKIENDVSVIIDSDYGAVFSDMIDFNAQGEYFGTHLSRFTNFINIPDGNILKELIEIGQFVTTPTLFVRTQIAKLIQGYDEGLPFEDYDFTLRLAIRCRIKFSERITVKYRIHDGNYSKNIYNSAELLRCHLISFYKIWGMTDRHKDLIVMRSLYFLENIYRIDKNTAKIEYSKFNLKTGHGRLGKYMTRLGLSYSFYCFVKKMFNSISVVKSSF